MNENIKKLRAAKSIQINQQVYEKKRNGEKVITLSLGEAYFDIPNFGFEKIDHTRGYHYCDTQGLPELRIAISNYYKDHHSTDISESNIIISAGSKILTYLTMALTLNNGDEVILHEPAWLSYQDQATLCGAVTKYIPYNIGLDDFDSFLTSKTKLIVINNPNNPSGFIYEYEKLEKLVKLAQSKGIFLLIDEAYSDFVNKDSKFQSLVKLVNEYSNLIVVNSISKNFGMSGWRVGYAIVNDALVNNFITLNQHTLTCAPTPLQIYLSKYLEAIYNVCEIQIAKLIEKRNVVMMIMDRYGIKYLEGSATFYFFIDLQDHMDDAEEFCELLLSTHGIAVVPGSAYGNTTKPFIRLSIGTESIDNIDYAIKTIRDELNKLPNFISKH
nr:aspartate aminotransferase [Vibrio mimicus]